MSHHVTEKLVWSHSKRTLGGVKVQLVFPQNFKDVSEVSHMLGYHLTLHHHVIYVDFNVLAQLWFKHSHRHHPLIGRPCVFHVSQGPFDHCKWWTWADGIAKKISPPLSYAWKVILRFDSTPYSWYHFLSLYKVGSCFYFYNGALHRKRKFRLVEFLTFAYNYHSLYH